jgi:6-phosphogluconolactonase (cycloisomerase 2 family)/quercetin dioxygenase-like cupin family protein
MFKKKSLFRLPLIGVAIASFVLALLVFHPARADWKNNADWSKNSLSAYVYTQSNIPTENGNSILGFRRDENGNLTPLPGSPFPTKGKGITDVAFNLAAIDGDRQIITNPEKTRLFAVNSGSGTIAVFDIARNGSLSPVKGSPFPSGGVYPVSLALVDDILFVANKNIDPQNIPNDAKYTLPNYTSFRVNPQGRLIPRASFNVPRGNAPEAIVVSPDQKFLFGIEQFGQVVRSFVIERNGRFTQAPNSPLPGFSAIANTKPIGPIGIEVHPKQPYLYIGYPLSSKIGIYRYNQYSGEVTFLKTIPNAGAAVCWFLTNKAGTRLYTAESFSNTISVYDLTDPSTPVPIQQVLLKGKGSLPPAPIGIRFVGPTNIALDSNESYLYSVSQRQVPTPPPSEGDALHVLKVDRQNGTLTEVASSPRLIPIVNESRPQGLVAFQNPSLPRPLVDYLKKAPQPPQPPKFDGHKTLWTPFGRLTFIKTGEDTKGEYSLFDVFVPPLGGTFLHTHSHENELFYLVEGQTDFQLGDLMFEGRPGDFINATPGVRRLFTNPSSTQSARLVFYYKPSGIENFFNAVGLPVTDPINPPSFNLEEVIRIATQYGITFFT